MIVLRDLRGMGAVEVSVSDSALFARFSAPPERDAPDDEKPARSHLSLEETERDELARLREWLQMREELGDD